MSAYPPYYLEALMGNTHSGESIIHKFGQNKAVDTTLVPVSEGGIYRTPQVSGATKLRIKAGNTNDTAAGSGAQSVYIEGLDASGDPINEVLVTAGTSAGADSVYTYLRLTRAYVLDSGTYATTGAGSHAANVVIEKAAGSEDWATISLNGYPDSQTEIGWYTIPRGKTGFIITLDYSVDSTKITTLQLVKRAGILDTSAPYKAMRKVLGVAAIIRDGQKEFHSPLGPIEELSDVGFLAKIASAPTAAVEVHFGILLRDNE